MGQGAKSRRNSGKIFGFSLNASWFQLLSLTMFWSLFKSLVHAPCNNDEDKQRPQNFFYFYIATTPIKIRDITEESKNQFSGMNIASQLAPCIHIKKPSFPSWFQSLWHSFLPIKARLTLDFKWSSDTTSN